MSDFLSNFKPNNYDKTKTDKDVSDGTSNSHLNSETVQEKKEIEPDIDANINDSDINGYNYDSSPLSTKDETSLEDDADLDQDSAFEVERDKEESNELNKDSENSFSKNDDDSLLNQSRSDRRKQEQDSHEEDSEFDPTYKKKKMIQNGIIIAGVAIVVIAIGAFYYSSTHTKMPNFEKKELSTAREWATKNKITLDIASEYSNDFDANTIINQSPKTGKTVKHGATVKLTSSEGANPDDVIALPDFSNYSVKKSEEWIKQNKAENLTIIQEYNDTVPKGNYIRQEIRDKEITPETYRRKDSANLYYSKGKETFEKNISMPDFTKKAKSEVESWAKTNEMTITYEEADSDTIDESMIISQSVPPEEKVAKRDSMSVVVSLGKATIVPNYGEYDAESAATASTGLSSNIKSVFSSNVAFGNLISQSIPAGTKLTSKDTTTLTVEYSAGRPYLKSYVGQLEGDIPKLLFDDYNSKGANVTYGTNYVDSGETKGTIVSMSTFNEYIPLDFYVTFNISKGNLTPTDTEASPTSASNDVKGGSSADKSELN